MTMFRTALSCLCLVVSATPAASSNYDVAAMLRTESYGAVWIAPGARVAVVERRQRYDTASDYGLGSFTARQLSKLMRIDLTRDGPATPLFEQPTDTGFWAEGFSPSGRYLSVMALKDRKLRAGLFDMESRELRWLDLVPDLPFSKPGPLWIDDDHLLMVAFAHQRLPRLLDGVAAPQARIEKGWRMQAGGRAPSLRRLTSRDESPAIARNELRLIDRTSGAQTSLIAGEIADFALSADRRFVAVVTLGRAIRPGTGPIGLDFQPRTHILTIIDLRSGGHWRPCGNCDIGPDLLRWSPKGASLLAIARHAVTDAWEKGALLRVDPGRHSARFLADGRLAPAVGRDEGGGGPFLSATWAGSTPLLYAETRPGRADWYALNDDGSHNLTAAFASPPRTLAATGPDHLSIFADGRLWRVDLTGHRQVLADHIAGVGATQLDGYHFGQRGLINMPPYRLPVLLRRHVGAPMLRSGAAGAIVNLPASATLISDAIAHGRVLILDQDASGIGSLIALDAKGPRIVDHINRHLMGMRPGRFVPIAARSPDGMPLTHWLLLPVEAPAGRLPLIVIPYPGTVWGADNPPTMPLQRVQAVTNGQLAAARGYAVLYPSLPLPLDAREPLPKIVAGVDAAVDAAIASGLVDPDRMAVWGQSYGGYSALAIATRSHRYRTIIASAAPSDLIGLYGSLVPRTDADRPEYVLTMAEAIELGQFRMGGPPWATPESFLRNSPLLAANRIETPLLLIHGDMDFVPISQAERMFAALVRRGRTVELLRYAGENHVSTSPANIADQLKRVFAWLATYLRPH